MKTFSLTQAVVAAVTLLCVAGTRAEDTTPPVIVDSLIADATSLRPLVKSTVGKAFLDAVPDLPSIGSPRVVYYNKATRRAFTAAEAEGKSAQDLEGYEKRELTEEFYYYTRYGTPLAFVRPLDLLGQAGLETVNGRRVIDFGYGSIGQLRVLASLGAHAVGIEVDDLLRALYSEKTDIGPVARATAGGKGEPGTVRLVFGNFPAGDGIAGDVGTGYHAFISKNTLKKGYIHPAVEVDPRMLVHLGVDDETFVRAVYDVLAPGGYFMIYNLYPAQSAEKYIPWADGETPFAKDVFERVGFTLIAYDVNDTPTAREMGKALGWDEQMNLETDLFGIYTIALKPVSTER
jgi:hypothetical protein